MRNTLAITAGLLAIMATIPYILDTLKGKTRPNVVTWFTWSLLSLITAVAAYAGGARHTAILAGAESLCTVGVVIAGLKVGGIKRYTKFDVICQFLAIIGIILWRITNQPATAILLTIISDCIAILRTYRHSWTAPREETWQAYAIGSLAAVFAISSLAHFGFVNLAYPLYIFISNLSLVIIITERYKLSLRMNLSSKVSN